MLQRLALVVFLTLSCCPLHAAVQQQPELVQQPVPQQEQQQQDIPWPLRLGLRVMQVEQVFPLIDRVVLVPDAATYLDELAKWSPRGRWPVLIEDAHLAPMFIRRFRPAEVIRRESVGDAPVTQQAIENVVITAFGGQPASQSLRQTFDMHGYAPPGAVVASINDSAWTAAVALAAGRGQPLIWIDQRFARPDNVIELKQADDLAALIEQGLGSHGWSYAELGDDIDAITICRSIAGRVNLPRPDNGEVEPAAITDFLGRHIDENGSERFAFVGWIFGDEIRSAYMAMCSLFLPRMHVTMYDTYGFREQEGWSQYNMTGATAMLSEHGWEVTHLSGRRTNEAGWLGMIADGLRADVLVMNSRGNPYEFEVYEGRVWPPDVPVLHKPVALHLTHSWSLRSPDNANTVGGRWLERGAYAYVGSTQEPYLSGFLPPKALAGRWLSRVPFLVGARYWDGNPAPFGGPWKINTIGDPLMVILPPLQFKKDRVEQAAAYGTNLNDHAQQLLLAIREASTGDLVAEAVALLDLLGRDDIALPLWNIAATRGDEHIRPAARAALGPLFRARDVDGFMHAWMLLDHHDDLATDMLWHLHTPRLNMLGDDDLLHLQSAIRRGAPHVDIRRLAPHLAKRFGSDHVRSLIQNEIDDSEVGRNRNHLQRLLREYEQ